MTMAVGEIGERTQLTSTDAPRWRGLAWVLLAIAIGGGAITGWLLYERGRLASDEAAAARTRETEANQRAAAAEDQILTLRADKLRPAPVVTPDEDLAPLAESLKHTLDKQAGEVAVDDAAHQVIVTLDDPDLFRGDDAELTHRGEMIVDQVAGALVAAGDRPLWINGHVDDAPLPDDSTFDTAWQLSGARALAVLARLQTDGIDARRLAAVAYGSSHPVGADRAKNRRIEVVVDEAPPAPASARSGHTRDR